MSCCCFHWGSFNHSASTPLLLESHSPERTASSAPPDFPPSETPPPAALSPSPSAAPEIGSTPGCRKPPENFPTAAPRAAGSWYPATPGPRTPSDGCLPHPGSSWRCETLRSLGSSPASLGSDPDRCRCERWSAIPPLQKGALFPQQTCCPGSVSSSPSWSSASGYGCTGWLQFLWMRCSLGSTPQDTKSQFLSCLLTLFLCECHTRCSYVYFYFLDLSSKVSSSSLLSWFLPFHMFHSFRLENGNFLVLPQIASCTKALYEITINMQWLKYMHYVQRQMQVWKMDCVNTLNTPINMWLYSHKSQL